MGRKKRESFVPFITKSPSILFLLANRFRNDTLNDGHQLENAAPGPVKLLEFTSQL